jgi:hypothetical protein
MALGLAEAGADTTVVGREEAALDQTAADIRARGRRAFTIRADVGQPGDAERACGRPPGPGPPQPWKISSGRRAETTTFGASTTLLIRRSTATLAIT